MRMDNIYVYQLGDSLYVNLTNRCTNRCSFCVRNEDGDKIGGYDLWLEKEPTAEEIIKLIEDPIKYDEIVFCGYGEPTIKLDEIIEVAKWIKGKGGTTRINTNGQANLYHGYNVVPKLKGLIDTVSISLNAKNAKEYEEVCHSDYGEEGFYGMLDFARECSKVIPNVVLSVVDILPEEDIEACRRIAEDVGATLRVREMIK
jgi:TatD family-associated radical SAM protein